MLSDGHRDTTRTVRTCVLQVTVDAGSTIADTLDETNRDCTAGILLIRVQRRFVVIKNKQNCALSYMPILTMVTTMMTVCP